MDSPAYALILEKIASSSPSGDDGAHWDHIKTVIEEHPILYATDVQRLVEIAAICLFKDLTDALSRIYALNSKDPVSLTTGVFPDLARAIADFPERTIDLGSKVGSELCDGIRRMIEERWAIVGAVPMGWEEIRGTRNAESLRELEALLNRHTM